MHWRNTGRERGIKMADKKEPIYWITVNGAHVPIYEETAKWMPFEMRERYSRYIDDHSHDHQLDSDEKTWVEALRREKYQQQEDQKERQIAESKKQADKLLIKAILDGLILLFLKTYYLIC